MAGSKDAQGSNQLKRKRPAQAAAPQKKFKQSKRPSAPSAGLQTPERYAPDRLRQQHMKLTYVDSGRLALNMDILQTAGLRQASPGRGGMLT